MGAVIGSGSCSWGLFLCFPEPGSSYSRSLDWLLIRVPFWEVGDALLGSELGNDVLEPCNYLASLPLHPTPLKYCQ